MNKYAVLLVALALTLAVFTEVFSHLNQMSMNVRMGVKKIIV